jgi:glycosyltransferase involved in cell wall biosynthesis
MSVFCQTYDNWLILIRDDMSTDETIARLAETCHKHDVTYWIERDGKVIDKIVYDSDTKKYLTRGDAKVLVVENVEKFWEVKNVLSMIREDVVRDDDIICRLDGDDFLTDLCALQDINVAYQQSGCEALWTAHRWGDTHQNISQAMPSDADPYKYPWVSSHFKTFKKYLINDVKEENFYGADGEYIKRTGDQAIYLPVLHKTKKRVFFPKQVYYYTIDMSPGTFQTEDAKFQQSEGQFLRNRGFVS